MKPQSIQLFEVGRRELLKGVEAVKFIKRIVRALHTRIEKVASVGSLAIVGYFRIATIHRKIRGRRSGVAEEQPRAGTCKAK